MRIYLQSLATVVGLAVARRLKLPFMGMYTTPETPTQAWPYMPHGGGKVCFYNTLHAFLCVLFVCGMHIQTNTRAWPRRWQGMRFIRYTCMFFM